MGGYDIDEIYINFELLHDICINFFILQWLLYYFKYKLIQKCVIFVLVEVNATNLIMIFHVTKFFAFEWNLLNNHEIWDYYWGN